MKSLNNCNSKDVITRMTNFFFLKATIVLILCISQNISYGNSVNTTPTVIECEASYAYSPDNSFCFQDYDDMENLGVDETFNRWGWVHGPIVPSLDIDEYEYDIYSSAGNCNLNSGYIVGTATLTIEEGGDFTVEIIMNSGWIIEDVHIYLHKDYLPVVGDDYTVAPGQYPYIDSGLSVSNYSWSDTVEEPEEDQYFIIHATVCEEEAVEVSLSQPDLTDASDTGVDDEDDITSDNTPTITGTVTGEVDLITIFVDGVAEETVVPSGGEYTVTISNPLSEGEYEIYASFVPYDEEEEEDGPAITSPSLFITILASNVAPIAICQDISVDANGDCQGIAEAEDFDDGSSDPDGDPITFSVVPSGPYPLGETPVILSVNDGELISTCSATITVVDNEDPVITCPAAVMVDADPGECTASNVNLGTPVASDNCSFVGNALDFDGVDDEVNIGNDASINPTNNISLECWVDPGNLGTRQYLIHKPFTAASEPYYQYHLEVRANGIVYFALSINGVRTFLETHGTPLVANQWQHVAATYDGANMRIYINGIEYSSSTAATGSINTYATNTLLGHKLEGKLNEVRLWNTARTQAEIQANMNSQLNVQAGLVASYHLDEGIADGNNAGVTITTDASGNGNDGTLDNFTLTGSVSNWVVGNIAGDATMTNDAPVTFPVGTTTVTWTTTDAAGNTSTCTQDVTVEDNEAPVITCLPDVTINTDPGECAARFPYLHPVGIDNCPGAVTVLLSGLGGGNSTTFPSPNGGVGFPAVGTRTNIWQVTDAAGNTATCSFNVTVVDNEDPVITCPADITVSTDPSACEATGVSLGTASATDNCNMTITTSNNAPVAYGLGVNIVTWTADDGNGNTATCTQTITVEDNEDPTITCPADVTLNNNPGECFASLIYTEPVGSDNCSIVSTEVTSGWGSGGGPPVGIHTVTWTTIDGSGNEATCSFGVTVLDNEGPVLSGCPSDVTVSCDNVPAEAAVTVSDNCDATVTVIYAEVRTNGISENNYTLTRTWTSTDVSGNSVSCGQVITVEDTDAPVLTGCPSDVTVECDNVPAAALVTVVDNCPGAVTVDFTEVRTDGTSNDNYTLTRTWTSIDVTGNTVSCSQEITVEDTTDPIITCPEDITVSTDLSACEATGVSLGTASATDNCNMTITTSNNAPVAYGLGVNIVTWTADDGNGNVVTCTQSVTVEDNENPTITCSAAQIHNTDVGDCQAVVTVVSPSIADNCVSNSINLSSTNTITIEAWIYPSGVTSADGIVFTRNPVAATGLNIGYFDESKIGYHWNDNPSTYTWTGGPTYTMNEWNHVALVIEPTKATIYLNGIPTVRNVSNPPLNLESLWRIGRDPCCGNRRFDGNMDEIRIWNYARTSAQINAHMNTELAGSEIGLVTYFNLNQGVPSGNNSGEDIAIEQSSNFDGTLVAFALNGSTSNWVSSQSGFGNSLNFNGLTNEVTFGVDELETNLTNDYTNTSNASAVYPVGTTMVTWTVTDAAGNTSSCTQDVTVEDNEPPVAVCNDITIDLPNRDAYVLSAADIDAIAAGTSDNCDFTYEITAGQTTYNCDNRDENFVVTLTITDASGNETSCDATVNIIDSQSVCNDPPVVLCQDITINVDSNCEATIVATQVDGGSTDPDGDAITLSVDNPGPFGVGIYTVILSVSDGEYTETCEAMVTVQDLEAPTFTDVPEDITINCQDAIPTDDATAADNCTDLTITTQDVYATGSISNNGLLGAWSFDEVAGVTIEDVLQASDGDIQGASITRVSGQFTGNAVQFSGSGNDDIEIANGTGGALDAQYTVSMFAWIIPGDNANQQMPILAYDTESGAWGNHMWQTGTNQLFFRPTVRGSYAFMSALAANVLIPGEWNHVGASYDYTTGKTSLYHNGVEVASITNPINQISTNLPIRIGAKTGDGRRTNAVVDNAMIYNRILTPVEIEAMFTSNCPQSFTVNRFYTVEDASGNMTGELQHITVVDEEAPVFTACPVIDIFTEPGSCSAVAYYEAIATDNCTLDANLIYDYSIPSGSIFEVGSTDVTVTATDECGNVSDVCTITVSVTDNEAPLAVCQDITVQLDDMGNATITSDDIDNMSSDACGIASIVLDNYDYDCSDVGEAGQPNIYALDFDGQNDYLQSMTTNALKVIPLTVEAWVKPEMRTENTNFYPNNVVSNDTPGQYGHGFGANVNSSVNLITIEYENGFKQIHNAGLQVGVWQHIACVYTSGNVTTYLDGVEIDNHNFSQATLNANATFIIGKHNDDAGYGTRRFYKGGIDEVRVWHRALSSTEINDNMFTTSVGNEDDLSLYFTFEDGPGSTSVTDIASGDMATLYDMDPSTDWITPGAPINVGGNIVTMTVTDVNGNVSVCSAGVAVQDNIDPTITSASDQTEECDGAGNVAALNTWLSTNGGATASDACGVTWSNDFTALSDDCGNTGSATVTFTATDPSGNSVSSAATFTIVDTTVPSIDASASDLIVECDGAGNTAQLDAWLDTNGGASASDVCSGVSWTNDFTALSNDCGSTGEATVTFTATDDCGNTSVTTATFAIEDNTVPSIDVSASDLTVECDGGGNTTALNTWLASNGYSIASDICGGVSWSNNYTGLSDDCGNTGSATVTFTATDDCGNTSETTATFTIVDMTNPDLTCPADIATCADQDLVTGAVITWDEPMNSDVCGDVSISSTHSSGDVFSVGVTAVTYTAVDDCGNTTVCTFEVTVYELPEISISESEESIYCQGDYKILSSTVVSTTGGLTYSWSTGEDTADIDVNTTGNYSVVVTDANGCTRETSYDVTIVVGDLLSGYTIIGQDEVHLHGDNVVLNGGVGVIKSDGKIKLHHESLVNGPTTFTKADVIDINNDSESETQIFAQTDVTLPPFIMNPFDSDNDVTVNDGDSETLTETIYGKIKVKKNATIEFTATNIFLEELKVEDGGTVIFAPCSFISVEKKIDFKKDVTVNAAGYQVHMYTEDKLDVKEGSLINASIDARGKDIKVKGKENNPTFMNGQYIGKKVHGDKYVTWDWSDACDPSCEPDELPENITCECDGGIQQITIEYAGGTGANLTTNSGTITDNGDGTYTVYDGGEKLDKDLEISDDTETAEIHTSCSDDILGVTFAGDFTVVSYIDKYGGVSNVDECPESLKVSDTDQELSEEVIFTESREGITTEASMKVYPNPASYNLNIDVEGLGEEYTIYIFDQLGRQLWKSAKKSESKHQEFDIRETGFTGGLYQVILKSENHFITKKILIIR